LPFRPKYRIVLASCLTKGSFLFSHLHPNVKAGKEFYLK
jgi:hypothetical protein